MWRGVGVVCCLFIFSKHVGINDSNEVQVLAILKALRILSSAFHDKLNHAKKLNAILWENSILPSPWKFQNEIEVLSSSRHGFSPCGSLNDWHGRCFN